MPYSKVTIKHVESTVVALGLVPASKMEAKAYEVPTLLIGANGFE